MPGLPLCQHCTPDHIPIKTWQDRLQPQTSGYARRRKQQTQDDWRAQVGWLGHVARNDTGHVNPEPHLSELARRYRAGCKLIEQDVPSCHILKPQEIRYVDDFSVLQGVDVTNTERPERHSAPALGENIIADRFILEFTANEIEDLEDAWIVYATILVDTMHRFSTANDIDIFDVHLLHNLVRFLWVFYDNLPWKGLGHILEQTPFPPTQEYISCCQKRFERVGDLFDRIYTILRKALCYCSYVGFRRSDIIYHHPTGLVYTIRYDDHTIEVRDRVETGELSTFLKQRDFLKKPTPQRVNPGRLLGLVDLPDELPEEE